jgi:hypothetical protein
VTLVQTFDEAIDIDAIHEHPANPRRGDDDAVAESIEANGFWGGILVQRSTGAIIGGNTRYRAMRAAGETTIPGFWIDCDDAEAKRIMLADNRTSDLAFYDDPLLVSLLGELHSTPEGLYGTGYDDSAYDLLLRQTDRQDEPTGVGQGNTPGDRRESYDAADVRSLILAYDAAEYAVMVENLAKLRATHGVDTNAEVVAILVSNSIDA